MKRNIVEISHFSRVMLVALVIASAAKIVFFPLEQLRGLGDITHFYNLAQIPGLPFLDYWVEFPPISVYLFELFYWVVQEDFQHFTVLFLVFISLVNIGNFWFFARIVEQFTALPDQAKKNSLFIYLLVLLFLPYSWWYFDGLTVLFLLIGFYFFLMQKFVVSISSIAVGVLTKIFPVLFLMVYLKQKMTWRKMIILTGVFLMMIAVPYLFLWRVSPQFTQASLVSQAMKGSWETVWALMDGNYQTGNFGPLWERLEAGTAYQRIGNAPVVDGKITLLVFGLLGLLGISRKNIHTPLGFAQLILFTECIFFLWSPGWSPQWVLYVIPFVLMAIPNTRIATAASVGLSLINVLEWPLIIGLQLLHLLPVTILLRTVGFVTLALYLNGVMGRKEKQEV